MSKEIKSGKQLRAKASSAKKTKKVSKAKILKITTVGLENGQIEKLSEKVKDKNFSSASAFFRAAIEEWNPKKRKAT